MMAGSNRRSSQGKHWFRSAGAVLSLLMAVQNLIGKVQKRNRALVKFDPARIWKAIIRAAESGETFGCLTNFHFHTHEFNSIQMKS
jgi:hypothetical protein